MTRPTVGVVIAVRDGAAFVGEAVRSAWADGVAQVVVADDGSRDDSPRVAAAAGAEVLRLPARSAAHARNRGLAALETDLVRFVDADDRLAPGGTARLIEAMLAGDAAGAVGSQRVFGDGVPPGAPPIPGRLAGTALLRCGTVRSVGGFDEALERAEGVDLFARLDEQGHVLARTGAVVLERRRHDANLSSSDEAGTRAAYLQVARAAILRRRDQR